MAFSGYFKKRKLLDFNTAQYKATCRYLNVLAIFWLYFGFIAEK